MMKMQGWALTGWVAIALVVAVVVTFATQGWHEDAVRVIVRFSAKVAVCLFVLAFSASSVCRLRPSPVTKWILRNRRYLGVGYAVAHTVHLGALGLLALFFPEPFVPELQIVTLVGGGTAYAFTYAMAFTSSDRAVAALGRKRWHRLHLIGGWYIWVIFAQSYLPRAFEDVAYAPFAALIVAAPALRITAWTRGRRRAEAVT